MCLTEEIHVTCSTLVIPATTPTATRATSYIYIMSRYIKYAQNFVMSELWYCFYLSFQDVNFDIIIEIWLNDASLMEVITPYKK